MTDRHDVECFPWLEPSAQNSNQLWVCKIQELSTKMQIMQEKIQELSTKRQIMQESGTSVSLGCPAMRVSPN